MQACFDGKWGAVLLDYQVLQLQANANYLAEPEQPAGGDFLHFFLTAEKVFPMVGSMRRNETAASFANCGALMPFGPGLQESFSQSPNSQQIR